MEPSLRRSTYSSLRSSPSLSHAPHEDLPVAGIPVKRGHRHPGEFLGRVVAHQVHECRIGDEDAAVARSLVHALHHAFEQAAKFRFAVAQGILGAAALDGDARDLRHPRHQLLVARRRQCPAWRRYTAKVPTTRPSEATMGVDQAARSDACCAASRRNSQSASVSMSATVTWRGKVHGGGAGTVADADRHIVHRRHELARQIRRDAEIQRLAFMIEQIDGALALRHDAFDQLANRLERRGQRGIGGDLLEHPALARRDRVRPLALGDVGDAGADQAAIGTRQAHEAHFAGHAVCPVASQCAHSNTGASPDKAPSMKPRGRPKDGVPSAGARADLVRAAGEQGLARHLEKTAGIVVDVDEFALVDVEYHDHFGGVLHQGAVARLALAHRLLGEMPLGDVADADDVAVAPIELGLADGDLHRDAIAALGSPPGLMRRQIDVGVVDLGGEAFEKIARSASRCRAAGIRASGRGSPPASSRRCARRWD